MNVKNRGEGKGMKNFGKPILEWKSEMVGNRFWDGSQKLSEIENSFAVKLELQVLHLKCCFS